MAEHVGCEVLHDESCELDRDWECHCYERAFYRDVVAAQPEEEP